MKEEEEEEEKSSAGQRNERRKPESISHDAILNIHPPTYQHHHLLHLCLRFAYIQSENSSSKEEEEAEEEDYKNRG